MPDEEELDCAPHKRKTITWTPNAFLSSLGHDMGFSTSEGFNKEKVHQDWTSYNCQYLGVPIPHLAKFKHHECPCKRFAIDVFGDHLHTCTQHAGATSGAHEHILNALQRLFTKAGYRTDRKHVPRSRGMKKADLLIKDFQLQGIRNVIVDVTCRHEFRWLLRNTTTTSAISSSSRQSRRPPGESAETLSACFTYGLTAKQQTTSHAWASSIHPLRHSNNAEARTSITIAPPSASRAPRPLQ
jgi:hypothetical protein